MCGTPTIPRTLSGNSNYGIDACNPAIANLVQGNLIGLDANGTNAIANLFGGMHLGSGIQSNTIGGTVIAYARCTDSLLCSIAT